MLMAPPPPSWAISMAPEGEFFSNWMNWANLGVAGVVDKGYYGMRGWDFVFAVMLEER